MEKPAEKPTEVAALLLCPIHLQLFEDPVLCPCGHTFCRRCIVLEVNASGKCPFDGTALQASSLFPNQIIAEEVRTYLRNGGSLSPLPKPVRCSFEIYGCEWKGPAEALATHLSNCDYEKMKDFILKKERESSQLREEVKSKDEQIAQLRQMLSVNSSLHADLQRILKLALSLASQGKNAIERGVGQLAGHLAQGWNTVTDEKAYRELSATMEQTAVRCANSVKNVMITIQQASKHASDSELLAKLLAQTAQWKVKLANTLEDIRETFARISITPSSESSQDDKELREATRESLRTYLNEVQRINAEHEQEQTELVQCVVASLPPPPPLPVPEPSSSGSSSTVGTDTDGGDEDADGFVDIVKRPLPDLPSAQLRK